MCGGEYGWPVGAGDAAAAAGVDGASAHVLHARSSTISCSRARASSFGVRAVLQDSFGLVHALGVHAGVDARGFSRAGLCRKSCSDGYAGLWLVFGRERSRDACGRLWAGVLELGHVAGGNILSATTARQEVRSSAHRMAWVRRSDLVSGHRSAVQHLIDGQ